MKSNQSFTGQSAIISNIEEFFDVGSAPQKHNKLKSKPVDIRASHCETVEEYELWKFCNSSHGALFV